MTHSLLHEKPNIGAEKIEANDIDKRTDVYVLIEKLEYTRHLICSSESESPQTFALGDSTEPNVTIGM